MSEKDNESKTSETLSENIEKIKELAIKYNLTKGE